MDLNMKRTQILHKKLLWLVYIFNALLFVCLFPILGRQLFRCRWETAWKFIRVFARNGLAIFNIKVEVINPHNVNLDEQFIIIANHRSWFDQLSLIHAIKRPFHILSKKGYFDIPLFGRGMKEIECIPVSDKTISFDDFENILKYLEKKESLLIFIEGTRGEGREMLPFMPGAFKFSAFSNTPVLPVHIVGSEEILSKNNPLHSIRSGKILLVVEPPVVIPRKGYKPFVKEFEEGFRAKNTQLYDQHLGMNKGES